MAILMHVQLRRSRSDDRRPHRIGRTATALLAAAVLSLGPGSLAATAALADAPAAQPDAVAAPATEPQAAPVADPAPAPDPAPAVDPAPAPVVEPAPAATPDPAPAPVVEPAPVATPDPAPAVTPAPAGTPDPAPAPEPSAAAPDPQPAPAPTQAARSAAAAPAVSAPAAAPSAGNGSDNPGKKIGICHALGNGGFISISPNANGDVSGHAGMSHQGGRDIIPPFDYNDHGVTGHFPGQNWDANGQAIFNNNCQIPVPVPAVAIDVQQCTTANGSVPLTVAVQLSSLGAGREYVVVISKNGSTVSTQSFTSNGTSATLQMSVNGSGTYTAKITDSASGKSGTKEFTVNPCPTPFGLPSISLSAAPCTVPGGELPGSGSATLTGLVVGDSYTVTVTRPSGGPWSDTFTATATSKTLSVPLTGAGSYTASLVDTTHEASAVPFTVQLAPCPDRPTIQLSVSECPAPDSEENDGIRAITVTMGDLQAGTSYALNLSDSGGAISTDTFVAGGSSATRTLYVDTAESYTVELALAGGPAMTPADTATITVTECPKPEPFDLGIVKTASAPEGGVQVGDTIEYTLVVTNNGPAAASNVTVTDSLPAGLSFASTVSTASGWSLNGSGGSVSASFGGTFGSGDSATLVFDVTVDSLSSDSATLTNTACVAGDPAPTEEVPMPELAFASAPSTLLASPAAAAVDSNPGNDCSSATTPVKTTPRTTPPTTTPPTTTPPKATTPPVTTAVHTTVVAPTPESGLAVTGGDSNGALVALESLLALSGLLALCWASALRRRSQER